MNSWLHGNQWGVLLLVSMQPEFYPVCHGSFAVLLFASTSQLRYIIIIIQLSLKKKKITVDSMRHLISERNFYSAFESDSFWVLFIFYLIVFYHTSWQAIELSCVTSSGKHAYQVANNTPSKFKSNGFTTI